MSAAFGPPAGHHQPTRPIDAHIEQHQGNTASHKTDLPQLSKCFHSIGTPLILSFNQLSERLSLMTIAFHSNFFEILWRRRGLRGPRVPQTVTCVIYNIVSRSYEVHTAETRAKSGVLSYDSALHSCGNNDINLPIIGNPNNQHKIQQHPSGTSMVTQILSVPERRSDPTIHE